MDNKDIFSIEKNRYNKFKFWSNCKYRNFKQRIQYHLYFTKVFRLGYYPNKGIAIAYIRIVF